MDYQQLLKLQRQHDQLIFEASRIRQQIESMERESKEQKQKRLIDLMSKKGVGIEMLEKLIDGIYGVENAK